MRKPNLKPRIPDIAGNKKYDNYSPKSVGDASNVDKKLSGKSKALLVAAVVVSVGVGFSAYQMTSSSGEPVSLPAIPSTAPVVAGEEGKVDAGVEDRMRYDSKTSLQPETLMVGGVGEFIGQYDRANYAKSLKYSKDLEKKYNQNFKFYPIMGQDEKGIDILSDGQGFGFRASGNGDTLYGLLYGTSNDVQKWLDEYGNRFPEITGIYRELPNRLMSGKFKYDDISEIQRIAFPDILITVAKDGDYAKQVAGFSKYLSGSSVFEGSFKITVQVAGYEVLGKHMDDKGVSSLTYENFDKTIGSSELGQKYEFQIKSKD